MNKSFIIAVLMGVAASSQVASWKYPSSGYKSVVNADLFTFNFKTEVDFGYGTHYIRTDPVDDADDQNTETYGIHFYSSGKATFEFTALDAYYLKLVPKFQPFYFTPYDHKITYTSPEAFNGMTLSMSGASYLTLTTFSMKVYENIKTAEVSLYDTLFNSGNLLPEDADWTFDADY